MSGTLSLSNIAAADTSNTKNSPWFVQLRNRGLGWRLALPIPVTLAIAILMIWFLVPRMVASNATNDAIRASEQMVAQFKLIRAYYTENVINKIVKEGTIKPSFDHQSNAKAIPLPATMIHDLSAQLAQKETTVSLYSKYPFPNRKSRQLDTFQEQAWDFLTANPNSTFSRNEVHNGRQVVRVAIADTMVAQTCVNCHNSNAASPKTDWKLGDVRGVLEITSAIDTQLAHGAKLSNLIIIGAISIGLILLSISLVIARSVTRPLRSLSDDMAALAQNNNDIEIQGTARRDEIGQMARSVVVLRDAAMEKLRLEGLTAEQLSAEEERRRCNEEAAKKAAEEQEAAVSAIGASLAKLSHGDLTFRVEAAFPPAYQQLKDDFNAAMSQLQETMLTIVRTVNEIRSGTSEFSQATDDLSRRTEQQAASLEETAAAVDEITATVRKTADSANHAKAIVSKARDDAEKSGGVVGRAVEAMTAIESSAKKISQIIGVIDEIAFQTNLLALNAGVEAARAGDAGRGFAVVASEVRLLAQRSAEAAKEIKGLISASSTQVDSGVNLVGQTGKALDQIVAQVTEINGVVVEIASSAHEQATGLAQVNTAVNQMDQVTQQNAAMVEESTAASHSLAAEAQKLAQLLSRFQVGIDATAEITARKHAEPKNTKVYSRAAAPRAKTNGVGDGLRALIQHGEPQAEPKRAPAKPARVPHPAVIREKTNGSNALAIGPQQAPAEESWEEF